MNKMFIINLEYGYYNKKAYIGPMDDFHELFEVESRDVRENKGLDALGDSADRLWKLYKLVIERL